MIETSQLQTLVAVARVRSFSRAAEALSVTQSAISQSVKNLENKVGVKLFKRTGKQVVLTGEGEKLHSLAQSFLVSLEDTLGEIQHDKDSMAGRVRVGTLIGVGKSWLAPEMLSFAKEHSELTVSLRMGLHEELVKEFERYQLDFLILPEGDIPSVGEKIFLTEEKISLVMPKGSPYDVDKDTTLEQLTKIPTILFENEDHLFLKWCRMRYGKSPTNVNVKYICNSHGNMLQAVESGLGIAVIPNHVLERSFYRDRIQVLNEYTFINGRFYIVYHKGALELLRIRKSLERLTKSKDPFEVE